MIRGRADLLAFLRQNEGRYWNLKSSERGNYVFKSNQELPDVTIDDASNELERSLDILQPGNYFFECWKTMGEKRNWMRDHYIHAVDQSSVNGQAPPPPPPESLGIPFQNYFSEKYSYDMELFRKDAKIEKLTELIAAQQETLKELEREIRGLENAETPLDRIVSRLEPHIGTILPALFPQMRQTPKPTVEVSGTDQIEEAEADQQAARLGAALEKWQAYESDPILIIEKIAELAATDEATYSMARNILTSK